MNRDALLRRINALRARTTKAGCTEAEALAAAQKVAELMQEFEVDADQLHMTEERILVKASPQSPAAQLWGTIAICTNTASIFCRFQRRREVVFVGREPWPSIAGYLLEVCENAIQTELRHFRKSEFYRRRRSPATKQAAARDFLQGLVSRLRPRLHEMFADRKDQPAALAAAQERDRRYPESSSLKQKAHKTRFEEALVEGWAAGGKINLSHGVDGRPQERRLIGAGS